MKKDLTLTRKLNCRSRTVDCWPGVTSWRNGDMSVSVAATFGLFSTKERQRLKRTYFCKFGHGKVFRHHPEKVKA